MTIRTGEKYVVETVEQFRNRLDVSYHEIANALDEEYRSNILASEQEHASNDDDYNPQCLADIPADQMEELLELTPVSLGEMITNTLEQRQTEYTHTYDNPVHRIIELQPPKEPVTPSHLS
jgi:hypothetical protein